MLGSAVREEAGPAVGLQAIGDSERLLEQLWKCLGMAAGRGGAGGVELWQRVNFSESTSIGA